jgi:hypothetical protein
MKKPLLDTFNRIGGKRLNEAHAWERQPGKPLPTMADVKAAHEAKSLQEDEYDDEYGESGKDWESSNGWNEDYFDDNGLMDALNAAQSLQYEIKNAVRGSHAVDGDSIRSIADFVGELQEQFAEVYETLSYIADRDEEDSRL